MDTHELPGMQKLAAMDDAPSPEMQAEAPPPREPASDPLLALDFTVHASMHYHAKRRAWFIACTGSRWR